MYNDLPDAPWIRDAETNGVPCVEKPKCPVCGSDDSDYFYADGSEVVGCDCCLRRIEVWDYVDDIIE